MASGSVTMSGESQSVVADKDYSKVDQSEVIQVLRGYISQNDRKRCRLVCKAWNAGLQHGDAFQASSAHQALHNPLIVEEIFGYLGLRDKKASRSVSSAFEEFSKRRFNFKPIMTDTSFKRVLGMGSDTRVVGITARNLFVQMPAREDDGLLQCHFNPDGVKSLVFGEGVASTNKDLFVRTFREIEELKFYLSTSFELPPGGIFDKLRKLEIHSAAYDESRSMYIFFQRANLPRLDDFILHAKLRFDYFLYQEIHDFIVRHFVTLEKIVLVFNTDMLLPQDEIPLMFENFPLENLNAWEEINSFFQRNTKKIYCLLRMAKCEGQGKFTLTTALRDNQRSIDPEARLNYDPEPPPWEFDDEGDDVSEYEAEDEAYFPNLPFWRLDMLYQYQLERPRMEELNEMRGIWEAYENIDRDNDVMGLESDDEEEENSEAAEDEDNEEEEVEVDVERDEEVSEDEEEVENEDEEEYEDDYGMELDEELVAADIEAEIEAYEDEAGDDEAEIEAYEDEAADEVGEEVEVGYVEGVEEDDEYDNEDEEDWDPYEEIGFWDQGFLAYGDSSVDEEA